MHVSIVGAGYVGLVTALSLAKHGHKVTLVDIRSDTVGRINRGICPFFEPGMQSLLSHARKKGLLEATMDMNGAVMQSSCTLICVGTPSRGDGSVDLTYLKNAAAQIGKVLKSKKAFHTVVVKSTVVPGSTHSVGKLIESESGKKCGKGFGLGMNPEFLREGAAVQDALFPDRIVIGSDDNRSRSAIHKLYAGFAAPIMDANIKTAEMIKYANNSFFALCVSFANEISQICERLPGVNAYEVMRGVLLDRRFSANRGKAKTAGVATYLVPGCGFGGSCFPKDVAALRQFSTSMGYRPRLVADILDINAEQATIVVEKLRFALGSVSGKRIAVLGVAFKPDTDDIRESPSLRIIDALLAGGAKIIASDPKALQNARKTYGNRIEYSEDAKNALSGADAAVLVTRWKSFARLTPEKFRKLLKRPVLLDCRGFYNLKKYSARLEYMVLGLKD